MLYLLPIFAGRKIYSQGLTKLGEQGRRSKKRILKGKQLQP